MFYCLFTSVAPISDIGLLPILNDNSTINLVHTQVFWHRYLNMKRCTFQDNFLSNHNLEIKTFFLILFFYTSSYQFYWIVFSLFQKQILISSKIFVERTKTMLLLSKKSFIQIRSGSSYH